MKYANLLKALKCTQYDETTLQLDFPTIAISILLNEDLSYATLYVDGEESDSYTYTQNVLDIIELCLSQVAEKELKAVEARYIQLSIKGRWVALTDEEYEEIEALGKKLDIIQCDKCNGAGGFEVPSMKGYGWEFCACNACDGHGKIQLPEAVKKELHRFRVGAIDEEVEADKLSD